MTLLIVVGVNGPLSTRQYSCDAGTTIDETSKVRLKNVPENRVRNEEAEIIVDALTEVTAQAYGEYVKAELSAVYVVSTPSASGFFPAPLERKGFDATRLARLAITMSKRDVVIVALLVLVVIGGGLLC